MRIKLDGVIYRFLFENSEEQSIWEEDLWNDNVNKYTCCDCGMTLNTVYRMIITLLDEGNLLPDDFKHFCCHCSFLDKVGLLDLRKLLTTADVHGDMIVLEFCNRISSSVWENIEIRVHDYRKYLFS